MAEKLGLGRAKLEGKGKKFEGPANKKEDVHAEKKTRKQKLVETEESKKLWRMFDGL